MPKRSISCTRCANGQPHVRLSNRRFVKENWTDAQVTGEICFKCYEELLRWLKNPVMEPEEEPSQWDNEAQALHVGGSSPGDSHGSRFSDSEPGYTADSADGLERYV